MQITAPLDDILASRSHVRVARSLDALPEGLSVTARDLERRAAVQHARALRVLQDFALSGLVQVRRAGRADLYEINREHVLASVLHGLFQAEASVEKELHAFLRAKLRRLSVREAYVFGSVARRESASGSDIDLAVVLPGRGAAQAEFENKIEKLAKAVRRRFGSELGVQISPTPAAKRAKGRVGRDLWRRIQAEGIPLLSVA